MATRNNVTLILLLLEEYYVKKVTMVYIDFTTQFEGRN